MVPRVKLLNFIILLSCISLLVVGIGYSDAAELGVTDTEILVGTVADTTGPLSLNGTQLNIGARLYFNAVNGKGGIHGRKLKLLTETDDYQTGKHIAALRKLIFVDKVFGFINNVGSSSTMAAAPILQQNKVPLLAPQAPQPALYNPPQRYIFAYYPDYVVNGRLLLEYAVEKMKGRQGFNVGVLYQDDDVGKSALKGIQERINKHKEMDIKIVSKAGYKRGEADLSSQALKIKAPNPDIVILIAIQGPEAAFLKEADKINWKPKFVCSMAAPPPTVIKLAGAKAVEGVSFLHCFFSGKMTNEWGVKEYVDSLKKTHPKEKPHTYGLCGYSIARLFVEGLNRAGRNLTRETFVDAMETINNFDTGSGIVVTYSPTRRLGCENRAFFTTVKDGKLIKETGWIYAK